MSSTLSFGALAECLHAKAHGLRSVFFPSACRLYAFRTPEERVAIFAAHHSFFLCTAATVKRLSFLHAGFQCRYRATF